MLRSTHEDPLQESSLLAVGFNSFDLKAIKFTSGIFLHVKVSVNHFYIPGNLIEDFDDGFLNP